MFAKAFHQSHVAAGRSAPISPGLIDAGWVPCPPPPAVDPWTGKYFDPKRLPPPHTGQMTLSKLRRLVKEGYGQGHREMYKPWLTVGRGDASPMSNLGHLDYPEVHRLQHPRSQAERHTFVLLRWLGAYDVRDAFPAWPFPHAHPVTGLPGHEAIEIVPGLEDVAGDDIDVGRFAGTGLSYVGTLDALVTWRSRDGYRLMAVENKPEDVVRAPVVGSRAKERLELTRRYCLSIGVPRLLVHAEHFPAQLMRNLDALRPTARPEVVADSLASKPYALLVERLGDRGRAEAMTDTVDWVKKRSGSSVSHLWGLVHLALWFQDIDHDLSKPLRPWEPPRPGGRALRSLCLAQMLEAAR